MAAVVQPSRPHLREPALVHLRMAVSQAARAVCSTSSRTPGTATPRSPGSDPDRTSRSDPGQLRSALGQKTVSDEAQQAGINEQEFLSQLSQNLPQFVDQLTSNGKVPSLQEIAAALTRK